MFFAVGASCVGGLPLLGGILFFTHYTYSWCTSEFQVGEQPLWGLWGMCPWPTMSQPSLLSFLMHVSKWNYWYWFVSIRSFLTLNILKIFQLYLTYNIILTVQPSDLISLTKWSPNKSSTYTSQLLYYWQDSLFCNSHHWIFYNYQFVFLNPFIFSTQTLNSSPIWQPSKNPLCLWVCFCSPYSFIFLVYLPHISEIILHLFSSLWLMSFSKIPSRSTHLLHMARYYSFLWMWHICTTSLCIHLSMDTQVAFICWLL